MKAALLVVALAAGSASAQGGFFPTIYPEDLLIPSFLPQTLFCSTGLMSAVVLTHRAAVGQRDPWMTAGLWLGASHVAAGLADLALSAVARDRTAPHLLAATHLSLGGWNLITALIVFARTESPEPDLSPPPLVPAAISPVVLMGRTVVGGKRWTGLGVQVAL